MMAAVPPYSRKATRLQLSLQSNMVVYHNFTAMVSAMSRRVSVLTGALESHFWTLLKIYSLFILMNPHRELPCEGSLRNKIDFFAQTELTDSKNSHLTPERESYL